MVDYEYDENSELYVGDGEPAFYDADEHHLADWEWNAALYQGAYQCVPGVLASIRPLLTRLLMFSAGQRLLLQLFSLEWSRRGSWLERLRLDAAQWTAGLAGICLLWSTDQEQTRALILITTLLAYFATMVLAIKVAHCRRGLIAIAVTLVFSSICQFLVLTAADFTSLRGYLMIAAMKMISLAFDFDNVKHADATLAAIFGYVFNPATIFFGPWVEFGRYKASTQRHDGLKASARDLASALAALAYSMLFLALSSCLPVLLPFSNELPFHMREYVTAQSYRFSHYFVCYLAQTTATIGGMAVDGESVTEWARIECPRSMTDVVVHWNWPMHRFLHRYIFLESKRSSGYFTAMSLTFVVSALLHGFNFQLTAVLLSLGLFAYAESGLRHRLADRLSACVESRRCLNGECQHRHKSSATSTRLINLAFTVLNIIHLAYLGAPFSEDGEGLASTGYDWRYTLRVWGQWSYASHVTSATILALSRII